MRKRLQLAGVVAVVGVLGIVGAAVATGGGHTFREHLSSYQEVPALATQGSGKFEARFSRFGDQIKYQLSYRDLDAGVTQAHIHLGQEGVAGGVSAFLCTNLANAPAGTQACPPAPATISGTIGPEDVIGPTAQGIEIGGFDELVDAMRAGATYVNVHSTKWPAGEIRAQLDSDHDH